MKTKLKKLVATASFVLLGAGAFAQTTQGTTVVSGSVNFSNETREFNQPTNNTKYITRGISLAPSVGYFVKDGLEAGLSLWLSQQTSKNKQDEGDSFNRHNRIYFSPYIQKYVALTEQLQLHATGFATVGFGNSKQKNSDASSAKVTGTSNHFGAGISPGLTYFATPKLGFSANFGSLSFSHRKDKPKDSQYFPRTYNSLSANLSPSSINLGVSYFIAR